ncbi:hypothetical protein KCV02_g46, partial [Aureobasidium melanogenum]
MAEEHAKLESLYEQGRSMEKAWDIRRRAASNRLARQTMLHLAQKSSSDEKAANRASILLHTRICLDLADSGGSEQDFVVVWVILVNKLEKDDVRGDGKVDTKQAVGIRLASQ